MVDACWEGFSGKYVKFISVVGTSCCISSIYDYAFCTNIEFYMNFPFIQ